MKKCPFCAEEIQNEAIKCKHCGEFIKKAKKWYFQPVGMLILFIAVGPLALPTVWFNPDLSMQKKIIITTFIVCIFLMLGAVAANSIRNLINYYNFIFEL